MSVSGGERGRPKGYPKSGGRKKGTPNGATIALADAASAMIEVVSGEKLPLEYVLNLMNDPAQEIVLRLDAAKALLPYFHRKLPVAIDMDVGGTDDLVQILEAVYGRR